MTRRRPDADDNRDRATVASRRAVHALVGGDAPAAAMAPSSLRADAAGIDWERLHADARAALRRSRLHLVP